MTGPWTRERIAGDDSLRGFGVYDDALVALTDRGGAAALWTRSAAGWTSAKVADSSSLAFAADGASLVMVVFNFTGESKPVVVRHPGRRDDESRVCAEGQVEVARHGDATWLAAPCETPSRFVIARRPDGGDWQPLGAADLLLARSFVVVDTGAAHLAGAEGDGTPHHYIADAAGVREVPLGDARPAHLALARCRGQLVGLFLYDGAQAALGRWDGAAWQLDPREAGPPFGLEAFALDTGCQAFAIDGFGELWVHGPDGWSKGPPLELGGFASPAIVVRGDAVHVAYTSPSDNRSGCAAWMATATLAE